MASKNKCYISLCSKITCEYNSKIKIRGQIDKFFRKYDNIDRPLKNLQSELIKLVKTNSFEYSLFVDTVLKVSFSACYCVEKVKLQKHTGISASE